MCNEYEFGLIPVHFLLPQVWLWVCHLWGECQHPLLRQDWQWVQTGRQQQRQSRQEHVHQSRREWLLIDRHFQVPTTSFPKEALRSSCTGEGWWKPNTSGGRCWHCDCAGARCALWTRSKGKTGVHIQGCFCSYSELCHSDTKNSSYVGVLGRVKM